MKIETIATLGALGLVAYLISRIESYTEGGKKVLNSLQDALSSGLYELFGPDENFGDSLFYNIGFPDGTRHAIGASLVDAQGKFQYNGVWYRMLKGKDGMRYAAKL